MSNESPKIYTAEMAREVAADIEGVNNYGFVRSYGPQLPATLRHYADFIEREGEILRLIKAHEGCGPDDDCCLLSDLYDILSAPGSAV